MSSLREKYEKSKKLGYVPRDIPSIYPALGTSSDRYLSDFKDKQTFHNNVNIDRFTYPATEKPLYTSRFPEYGSYLSSRHLLQKEREFEREKENSYLPGTFLAPQEFQNASSYKSSLAKSLIPNRRFDSKSSNFYDSDMRNVGVSSNMNYANREVRRSHLNKTMSPIKTLRNSNSSLRQPSGLYKVLDSTPSRSRTITDNGNFRKSNGIYKNREPSRRSQTGLLSKLRSYLNTFSIDKVESDNSSVNILKDSARKVLNINSVDGDEKRYEKRVTFQDPVPSASVSSSRSLDRLLENDEIDDTILNTRALSAMLEEKRKVEVEQELRDLKQALIDEGDKRARLIREHEVSTKQIQRQYQATIVELEDRILKLMRENESKIDKKELSKEYESLLVQQQESNRRIQNLELSNEELRQQLQQRSQELKMARYENQFKSELKSVMEKYESKENELILNGRNIQHQIERCESEFSKLDWSVRARHELSSEVAINSEKISESIGRALSGLRESNTEGLAPSAEFEQVYSTINSLLTTAIPKNKKRVEDLDLKIATLDSKRRSHDGLARLYQRKYLVLNKLRVLNQIEQEAAQLGEYLEDSQVIGHFEKDVVSGFYSKFKLELRNTCF